MSKLQKPAIIVIAYNRPQSLSRLLSSIQNAHYSDDNITLIISIDYYSDNNPCYAIADDYEWTHGKKIVIRHPQNLGLRKHVLLCGDYTEEYGSVILLEDDVVVSPAFYDYATRACGYYFDHEEVVGISLFSHSYNGYAQLPFIPARNGFDTYYEKWVMTWGECFCREQWFAFREWYQNNSGKLEHKTSVPHQITSWPDTSWSKYMVYYMDECNKYFVSPYDCFSSNYADAGVHSKLPNTSWQNNMTVEIRRNYVFSDLSTAIKYDLFFERILLEGIEKYEGHSVLIDLYGSNRSLVGYDYCVSTSCLPYKIVEEYGLIVKPIEKNILDRINGTGIYLYDLNCPEKRKKLRDRKNYRLVKYYYPMLQYKSTLRFLLDETVVKIRTKISRY